MSNNQSSSRNVKDKNTPVRTPEEKAILTTLAYSSIFSSPMNKEELWHYLLSSEKVDKKRFLRSLATLHDHIIVRDGYYALKEYPDRSRKRIQHISEVSKKYALAKKAARFLSKIDSIEFIGISGGVAAKNVTPEDDIDLFIIVKKDTIFISRFWILLILEFLGMRRKRVQKRAANKICVNLIIDTSSILWQTDKRDMYTAREIAQVQPLYEKKGVYNIFLHENQWITSFLPNAYETKKVASMIQNKPSKLTQIIGFIMTSWCFEMIMRYLQKALIKRHKTNEIVTNHQLAFHPKDYRAETLRQLKLKMRQLGLLTKV